MTEFENVLKKQIAQEVINNQDLFKTTEEMADNPNAEAFGPSDKVFAEAETDEEMVRALAELFGPLIEARTVIDDLGKKGGILEALGPTEDGILRED